MAMPRRSEYLKPEPLLVEPGIVQAAWLLSTI
jgi:hypothetical protein